MALIDRFEERPLAPKKLHSRVLCGYKTVTIGSDRVLQLETYGSAQRAIPGKVSQVLQLDEEAARSLRMIIDRAFPPL